jgi:dTDP-4-dehydrorhamnose reductase
MVNILVTGAGGMVGKYAPEAFDGYNLVLTDIIDGYRQLDIVDKNSVEELIKKIRPDYVLHLAAATDVDRCETDPEWALKVNLEGTRNVALACRNINSVMVYISTGAVFNGDKREPYVELDRPQPLSKYGLYKYEGERVIHALLKKFYIVRASWMIGGGIIDKKFVGKIMQKIVSQERSVKVVNDKFGSITYARDLLRGIRGLIRTDRFGTYHMTNEGMCSRYDIAMEIVNILGKTDIEIVPVSSDEFPLPAPRGRSEALENHNLKLLNLDSMQPWKDALREYIKTELLPLYQMRP